MSADTLTREEYRCLAQVGSVSSAEGHPDDIIPELEGRGYILDVGSGHVLSAVGRKVLRNAEEE